MERTEEEVSRLAALLKAATRETAGNRCFRFESCSRCEFFRHGDCIERRRAAYLLEHGVKMEG